MWYAYWERSFRLHLRSILHVTFTFVLPFLFAYETWSWSFWAETCSSLETTCCHAVNMVVFDGRLYHWIVSQHNGMSFVKVSVTKLYVIWAIESERANSKGNVVTVQEYSLGIAEIFFMRRAVQALFIQKDLDFERRLSRPGDFLLRLQSLSSTVP